MFGALSSVAARWFGRRPPVVAPVARPVAIDAPHRDSSLDRGVRDIRRTDARFDPSRFAGYAAMVFRDMHTGWMTRNVEPLRDRLTAPMYAALQARCARLRDAGHAYRADDIDVTAQITGAGQDGGRDYVTAYVGGSMIDYTVVEDSGALVEGSRDLARTVEEYWTFTRPAGLNFWMLSAIQASDGSPERIG